MFGALAMSRRDIKITFGDYLQSYSGYLKNLKELEIKSTPKEYGSAIQGKHKKLKPRSKGNSKNGKIKKRN